MKKKLSQIRIERGLTQLECAKHLGLCRYAYGKKERGQTPFMIEEVLKLSKFLKFDINKVDWD